MGRIATLLLAYVVATRAQTPAPTYITAPPTTAAPSADGASPPPTTAGPTAGPSTAAPSDDATPAPSASAADVDACFACVNAECADGDEPRAWVCTECLGSDACADTCLEAMGVADTEFDAYISRTCSGDPVQTWIDEYACGFLRGCDARSPRGESFDESRRRRGGDVASSLVISRRRRGF